MKKHIPILFLFLALFPALALYSQSPQGIPYQAVMRNADGSVMASSEAVLTFMIHDGTADGTVVYQESHSLTSNAQGLVSCVVGSGVVSQGNFSNINWGSGAKFLHVMMGTTDLGTQQMLSVPYALHSSSSDNANNAVNAQSAANGFADVSLTGDTLFMANGNFIIVPGISAANAPVTLTADSHSCGIQGVHNPNLLYGTTTDQEGNSYKTILIGNQRWFAENLKTSKFRNGELIPSELSNSEWASTTSGAFSYYNNDPNLNCPYGKLYNWYAVNDSRGLCPTGWHVSSNDDWIELRNFLGGDVSNVGGKLKAPGTLFWNSPNVGANNESGFTSIPGGARQADGIFNWLGYSSNYWTSTLNGTTAYFRNNVAINDDIYESFVEGDLHGGISVRCIQDAPVLNIQGCTDGAACNFLANANQDDGSCLYQNATCDDGNANTINDVINGSCVCAGEVLSIGQDYQGGKVAYIFQPGDAGYVAGETHGLIAAAQDLPGTYQWGCFGTDIIGADGQVIGTGPQNTLDIVNAGCGGAAQACADLVLNGYSDWFLPSKEELTELWINRDFIGGFVIDFYWSSSEYDAESAWIFVGFDNLANGADFKQNYGVYVRAVRAF